MSDSQCKVGRGLRYNSGKVRYELIPTHLLADTAKVLEFGARKYHEWNWCDGLSYSSVIGCLKRHIAAIERGEDIDPESGFRHTGHAICNLLFLEHFMNMKNSSQEWAALDDRPAAYFNNNSGNMTASSSDPERR